MTPALAVYIAGVPINLWFMFRFMQRGNRLWVVNAVSLVWCVGSVVRLTGVMT